VSNFDWTSAPDEEVDQQYSPSRFGLQPLDNYLADYAQLSAPFRGASLTRSEAPLLIYIHGGYWQRLSADDSLFNAADAQQLGISLHAVEYTLAPHATVVEIIEECINDVLQTLQQLTPSRVVIAGCSAGAHLAAMCARNPNVQSRIDGVALLSGIYDLRPIVRTPTNDPLHLTNETASAISPQLLPPTVPPRRALLAVGQHESSEFIRQNNEYGQLLKHQGADVAIEVIPGRDHFNLPYDLLRGDTIVGDWVIKILKEQNI
jgi:arylformamidase